MFHVFPAVYELWGINCVSTLIFPSFQKSDSLALIKFNHNVPDNLFKCIGKMGECRTLIILQKYPKNMAHSLPPVMGCFCELKSGLPMVHPNNYSSCFIIPPLQRSWKGGILVSPCPSVCLSVCGQNSVRSVSSTILIGPILYLHILSSNFRRCVTCKGCLKFQKFKNLANSLNVLLWLCLILTWDPTWLNSVGNHEAAGGILRTQAF